MELKGMGTSAYKMGGEITKETLELITSKINKIKAYNQEADHDVLNKPNGDCNVMLKERKDATEYTKTSKSSSTFNEKTDKFFL
jgi:hypothetical protein